MLGGLALIVVVLVAFLVLAPKRKQVIISLFVFKGLVYCKGSSKNLKFFRTALDLNVPSLT